MLFECLVWHLVKILLSEINKLVSNRVLEKGLNNNTLLMNTHTHTHILHFLLADLISQLFLDFNKNLTLFPKIGQYEIPYECFWNYIPWYKCYNKWLWIKRWLALEENGSTRGFSLCLIVKILYPNNWLKMKQPLLLRPT